MKIDEKIIKELHRATHKAIADTYHRWLEKLGMAGTDYHYVTGEQMKRAFAGTELCAVCGKEVGQGWVHTCGVTFCRDHDPDLPLNARVAKALGYTCWTDVNGKWRSLLGRFIPEGVEYPLIPPYDKHVDLAMGALEEYCKKNHDAPTLTFLNNCDQWVVRFSLSKAQSIDQSLPQAICEAIAKHAEGK